MADRNLALQLLITAKDEASAIFGKIFKGLNDSTNVIATKVREAFTGLFGGGLDSAAEFEAQLSKVQAKGGLTAETMAELKQVATDMGAKFGVSGIEAAKGMESLAAAGLDAQQIIQTLPSVMALAQVEAISMDDASAKLANSLTAVGLGFDQAGRMADVLSKAALESTTSASAVAEALSVAGGIATTSGLSFEQTAAALTALAKGGIEGSSAGTSLSAILTQLINPASTASIALNNLGISSRDLGEVIGALQQRGDSANTAILAFGETAGPGLRTLITQGQSGLIELTAAMQAAGGSAQTTADTMSGNLKGAMGALAAAWESVKTALFDPVLEPLAKAANDLALALNTHLKDGALKPIQEAIKEFANNSALAIKDFLASFDFTTVIPTLTGFAASAKEAFGSIADSGKAAADTMVVAWNGVTIILRGIGVILAGFSATVITTVESLSYALNAMGLVSDTVQDKLAAMAASSQNYVVEMRDNIVKDGQEMAAAWTRLTAETDKTAAAQRRLKESLPAQEIGRIAYSLKDYQQFAAQAALAAEKARQEFEAGKITGAAYAVAIQDAAEANTALSRATDAAAAAAEQAKGKTSDHAKELQGQIGRLEVGVTQAKKYADAVEGVVNAESAGIKAAISLAQAKGNTAEVQRLTIRLTEQEADGAVRIAKAKQAEQEAEAAVAKKKLELAQIQHEKNQITDQELALAQLVAEKEVAEAEAAQKDIELKQRQQQQAEKMAGPIAALIRLYEQSVIANTNEANAIERSYADKIRDLDTEIKIAEAKGDSVKASALKIEKAQAEADMEAALTEAKNRELDAEINLIEAKKLSIPIDEQITKAGKEKIAALDEEIAKLRAAQEANRDKAAAAQADANATKAAAEATKSAGDATEQANAQNKEASKGLIQISKSMWDLTDAAKAWYDQQIKLGAGTAFGYLGDIKRSFDSAAASEKDAAIASKELQDAWTQMQVTGDVNIGQLRSLIDRTEQASAVSAQYGYSVTKAGEEAIAELRSLEKQWNDLADTIESRNADLRAQLAELQGNKAQADTIRNETELTNNLKTAELQLQLARTGGNVQAIAEAQQNLSLIRQIYEAKQAQIEQEAASTKAAQNNKTVQESTSNTVSELANNAERAANAMNALNTIDLSGLHGQLKNINGTVDGLRSAL